MCIRDRSYTIIKMAATQIIFRAQQPFLCLLNVICAVFLSLPVSRTVAQRQTSREQKGTRTPDPLRVMHDDFLIFIALIRQIDEICYRSATNGIFKSLLIILLLSFLTTPCTTKQLSSIGSKM